MTADTFGTARDALAGLPVAVSLITTGEAKARLIEELAPETVVVIGNGANDVAMVRRAALGIAVIGPEGAAGELLQAAGIVVRDIGDALDLLDNPLCVKATLRG
jgi:soluble P-type ATPase